MAGGRESRSCPRRVVTPDIQSRPGGGGSDTQRAANGFGDLTVDRGARGDHDLLARVEQQAVSRDTVPVAQVDPDPDQPRRTIDQAALDELTASIKVNGLAVPILVRPVGNRFRIVAGERRWRVARRLGWTDIPAEVRDLDETTARWLQLVENVNRADLSSIEEARAYKGLLDLGETQQSVADRVGKTRSYIAQKLRLLNLPAPLALLLDRGALTEGHVRQLLRFKGFYRDPHRAAFEVTVESARGMWAELTTPESRAALTFQTLRSVRPLDWPPGWPFDGAEHPEIAAATEALWVEGAERREVLRWAETAYYYALLTVHLELSVADLAAMVNLWAELVRSAVVYVDTIGSPVAPTSADDLGGCMEWWGYHSDLRHAGLGADHEHLVAEALEQVNTARAIALPSIAQITSPERERYLELTGWSE